MPSTSNLLQSLRSAGTRCVPIFQSSLRRISDNVQGLRTGLNHFDPRSRSLRSIPFGARLRPHLGPVGSEAAFRRPEPEAQLLSVGSCRPPTCPSTTQPASTYSARPLKAADRDRHHAPTCTGVSKVRPRLGHLGADNPAASPRGVGSGFLKKGVGSGVTSNPPLLVLFRRISASRLFDA